ncbi:Clavaminate synthase-like protein [Sarocladium strictum]
MSAVLLRDACACPSCVHPSTNQRLFSAADIPASISAEVVEINSLSGTVRISWKNDIPGFGKGHTTELPLDQVRSLSSSGKTPSQLQRQLSQRLWTTKTLSLPDYDYETYMKDDKTLYDLVKQLRVHGLAFVTNIPGLESSLATIATRIGPIKDTFYGHTWDVRTVPQAINAAYTSSDLGFHTDLLYFRNPPHVQLLHCIQSASKGGANVFADAYRAAVDLFHADPEAFDTLSMVPVNYHYNHPSDNVYRTTKPVIDLRALRLGDKTYVNGATEATLIDTMDKINWGPSFLAPFSSHQDALELGNSQSALSSLNDKVDRWHEAAVKFNELLQRNEYLFERKMNAGDCVLFDNTRTLHSRRAFDGADVGKPRWLRGTYVDKDSYDSKYRVLQNQFG